MRCFFLLLVLICSNSYAEQIRSIAVYNFSAESIQAVEYTGSIDSALRSVFSKYSDVDILSRRTMEENLKRLNLRIGNSLESITKSGRSLGVDFVISGNVNTKGASVVISYRLYDTKNTILRQSIEKSVSGKADIGSETAEIVRQFTNEIGKDYQKENADKQENTNTLQLSEFLAAQKAGRIELQWKILPDQDGRKVRIHRAKLIEGPFVYLGVTTRNSYRDFRPLPDQNFYQLSFSVDGGVEHRFSETASISKKLQQRGGGPVLHAPTIISAELGVNSLDIQFLSSLRNGGAASHHIYQRLKGKKHWNHIGEIDIAGKASNDYSFTKSNLLIPGKEYEFSVTTRSKRGDESDFSDGKLLVAPNAPILRSNSTPILRKVELQWSMVDLAKGYSLYRKSLTEDRWNKIYSTTRKTDLNYVDDRDVKDGVTYQYYVAAYDEYGESGFVSATEGLTKPLPQESANFEVTGGLVKKAILRWSALEDKDISGYLIHRKAESEADTSFFREITFLKGNHHSGYDDNGLENGTRYSYKMAAKNLFGGIGKFSDVVTVVTKARPKPAKFGRASIADNAINLEWRASPNNDIRKYILYRMWESDGWEELARLEPTVFQYEDVELKPYRKLSYKIVALDVDGLESDSHITNSIESPVAVNLQVTTNNLPRKVRLTWNKQQLIDSYNLYRTPVSNLLKWEKIKVLKSGLSDFTDNAGLADGTRYQYKLIPVDSNGEIAASNTATAVTKPLPNPPEEFNVESGLLKSIRISWMASKDTDVGGYQIYRSTDGADLKPYERVRGHENSFFVDKGGIFSNLKDEDTFTYSIASFNQFGAQGPASEPKEATTMSVPRIVSGFAANLSDGSVSLSWTLNTEENITQYMVFRSNTTDCKKLLEIASLAQVISSYIDDSSEVSTGLCYAIAAKNSSNLVSVMSEMIKI